MRVYIIGNDGITLCRTAPAAVNNGEIAVASNEELHAAPLSAKRLLALWNALPDVEKRKKVGDRDALIDQAVVGLVRACGIKYQINRYSTLNINPTDAADRDGITRHPAQVYHAKRLNWHT